MKNLPFVIWMVGAPIGEAFSSYVNEYLLKNTYSDAVQGIAAVIGVGLYIFVAPLLYEKKI